MLCEAVFKHHLLPIVVQSVGMKSQPPQTIVIYVGSEGNFSRLIVSEYERFVNVNTNIEFRFT